MAAKHKSNGKEIEVISPAELKAPLSPLIPQQGLVLMEAMNGKIDDWAIKERPGPNNKKLKYIPHGYVRHMLNRVFGPFWSHRTIEIAPGKRYDIIEYKQNKKNERTGLTEEITVQEIIVMVELRIRIYNVDGTLLSEEYRTGTGGKIREPAIPFASEIQSAESDALKRAAFGLGTKFGLELYYDDDNLRSMWQEQFKAPETISQLAARITDMNIDFDLWEKVTGMSLDEIDGKEQILAAWEKWEHFVETGEPEVKEV